MPEDVDVEATDSKAADSEATIEGTVEDVESSEELYIDPTDEAAGFFVAPRPRNVEGLSDSESSPEADNDLVDAAPSSSSPAAPKQPKGGFADEDDLFS